MTELASKHASLLSLEDVIELFSLLEKSVGNHAAAADACGLTRKTTYDWYSVKDLKLDTKVKLLNTLMQKLPVETLEYLTSKSVNNASDILMTCLSAMYESIMEIRERELLLDKLELFNKVHIQYAGLLEGKYDVEVSNSIYYLKQKAKELNVEWIPKPSPIITVEHARILIPMIIREIISKHDIVDKKLSDEFNISEELIKDIRLVLQQTPTLDGFLPSEIRRKLEDVSTAITAITNPPLSTTMQEHHISNLAMSEKQLKGMVAI